MRPALTCWCTVTCEQALLDNNGFEQLDDAVKVEGEYDFTSIMHYPQQYVLAACFKHACTNGGTDK